MRFFDMQAQYDPVAVPRTSKRAPEHPAPEPEAPEQDIVTPDDNQDEDNPDVVPEITEQED